MVPSLLFVIYLINMLRYIQCFVDQFSKQGLPTVIQSDFSAEGVLANAQQLQCARLKELPLQYRAVEKHQFDEHPKSDVRTNTFQYRYLHQMLSLLKGTPGYATFKKLCSILPKTREEVPTKKETNMGDAYCNILMEADKETQCHIVNAFSIALGCLLSVNPDDYTRNTKKILTKAQEPLSESVSFELQVHCDATPRWIGQSTIIKELPSYYWLLQSIRHVSDAPIGSANQTHDEMVSVKALPGWTPLGVIHSRLLDHPFRVPLALISCRSNPENPDLTDFLVSIRGSKTFDDWRVNFSYDIKPVNSSVDPRIEAHRGYTAMGTKIWEQLHTFLLPHVTQGSLGEITITGQSLGSAVASIVAFHTTVFLQTHFPHKEKSEVRNVKKPYLVLFVAPLVGNQAFVDHLGRECEVRNIGAIYDPVTYLPCPRSPLCPTPMVPVPTGACVDPPPLLIEFPGKIQVTPKDLTEDWRRPDSYLSILSWHVCAVPCWLSLNMEGARLDQCLSPEANATLHEPRSICDSLASTFI